MFKLCVLWFFVLSETLLQAGVDLKMNNKVTILFYSGELSTNNNSCIVHNTQKSNMSLSALEKNTTEYKYKMYWVTNKMD